MSRISIPAIVCLFALGHSEFLLADETDCNFAWMLASEDGSKPSQEMITAKAQREAECEQRKIDSKKEADTARLRLRQEFNINADGMTDKDAINRLARESDQKRRDDKAQAELRAEQADIARAGNIKQALERQDEMLKNLGVNMKTADDEEDDDEYADEDDDGIDPMELQMYQRMVDSGVAPQCKDRAGEALIDCVDEALGEEE